jgi:hypothetical protein
VMILAIFARGNERLQLAAVQMLSQIDGPAASNALAGFAVFSSAGSVRSRAIELLKMRDPRDVVGRLIGLVHKPFKYQVRHVNGPGSPGELFVEGERFNIDRFYRNLVPAPNIVQNRLFSPDVPFEPFGFQNLMLTMLSSQLPFASGNTARFGAAFENMSGLMPGMGISPLAAGEIGHALAANPQNAAAIVNRLGANHGNLTSNGNSLGLFEVQGYAAQRDIALGLRMLDVQRANWNLEQMLAADVQFIEMTNSQISSVNDRTLPVLTALTGQNIGADSEKWSGWWADQLGYSYQSNTSEVKPTYTDMVADGHLVFSHSCFAAGTLVQTVDGPQPIESIHTGDRVLSQGTSSGELAFKSVIAAHHNPPARTLRIEVGTESIVATGIHRFWVARKGWTMARDLKAGDWLRIVGGTIQITAVEDDKTQRVYNLSVAEHRDFFVGTSGLLVHDFSFVQPVLQPFDRQPELGSPVAASK